MKSYLILTLALALAACGSSDPQIPNDGHVSNLVVGGKAWAHGCATNSTTYMPTELQSGALEVTITAITGDDIQISTPLGNAAAVNRSCLYA